MYETPEGIAIGLNGVRIEKTTTLMVLLSGSMADIH